MAREALRDRIVAMLKKLGQRGYAVRKSTQRKSIPIPIAIPTPMGTEKKQIAN